MQTERNFFEYLTYQYTFGGMTIRLLLLNTSVFLCIKILEVIGRLSGQLDSTLDFVMACFGLRTTIDQFLLHPWGLVTSCFAHFTAWHFLMNMLFLYYSGKMFETFFDGKRLLATYILGGIFGGFLELLAHAIFPTLQGEDLLVVGASGSIMAIFSALAFHRPQLMVMLFGVVPIRLIFLAAFFILADVFSLGMNDNIAHFAHIGGVLLGILSVQGLGKNKNIITVTLMFTDKILQFFKRIFTKSSKMRVSKRSYSRTSQFKTDEEYNVEAKANQERIDAILDKIAKSGYESLTKEEKKFLFNQSQK